MKRIFLMALMLAPAVGGWPCSYAAEPAPVFTLQNAFSGTSEGTGTLKFLFGKPRRLHVTSLGRAQADGTFRLEQTVTFEGEVPRNRVWRISAVGVDRFTATLSDAAGPVSGHTSGPRLFLRYRARGPFFMQQELRLMPDGSTIDNVGVVTLFGMAVGRLRETITRSDRHASVGQSSGNRAAPMSDSDRLAALRAAVP